MAQICSILPADLESEIFCLWEEFELSATDEANFARALDHLEVQIQHNPADLSTWEPIEYDLVYTKMDKRSGHDAFLMAVVQAVRAQAKSKSIREEATLKRCMDFIARLAAPVPKTRAHAADRDH